MNSDNTSDESDAGEETFRDRIATVDASGGRAWIYPRKPRGRFYRARTWLSWLLLAFLFGAPFIRVSGEPFMLLDVINRKFILFGVTFWPQDFYLFGLVMIAAVVFIFLFTAVFGRLFCGWICPQTIFMEMVFRKIEYLIEGDANRQRALNAAPWTAGKTVKKLLKQSIFFAISFVIGNTFLAWIIGTDALFHIASESPVKHAAGFTAIMAFSGAFYFVFAWFREQACTLVCPYGRLQSVLLDDNSIVIHYDFVRGEPRGKFRKSGDRSALGDCVDCRQCVVVCPTGIDIRNGTQLECVNCTACIDACDGVMDRVGLPRGLIRYASYNAIRHGAGRILTPRVIGYLAVLVGLIVLLGVLFGSRDIVQTTVLRVPGTLYQEKPGGVISNLYTVKIINTSNDSIPVSFALLQPKGTLSLVGGPIVVPAGGMSESAVFLDVPRANLAATTVPVRIGVYRNNELIETVETTFVGPGR